MKMKDIREFLKTYKITREELGDELSYAKPTMVNILNKKDEAEGRMKMIIYMGMKKILEKKITHYQQGLEDWEKRYKD